MSVTARELLQELADDAGLAYSTVARRVNRLMRKGLGLIEAVEDVAERQGLGPEKYSINTDGIITETERILQKDYTQTLMISAVLGQMVEARSPDNFPAPAFFAFLDLLAEIPDARRDTKEDSSNEIAEHTTRIIELMTTLVSVLCKWSEQGIVGISENCPEHLQDLARAVFRKTKLLQGGLWTCISCGTIVNIQETRALMCGTCDKKLSGREPEERYGVLGGKTRKGYGRTHDET